MELIRCLFYPGHEQGFNMHVFSEEGTATGNCILFSSETVVGGNQLFRSSIIVFLNLADCDICSVLIGTGDRYFYRYTEI